MVTITRYVFINILETEHFTALKFAMGYENIMNYFVIPKSLKCIKGPARILIFHVWNYFAIVLWLIAQVW